LRVEFKELFQPLRVVLETAADVDALQRFVVAFVGGAQVPRFERLAIRGEDEFALLAAGRRAGAKGRKAVCELALLGCENMNVASLEDAASDVGLIGVSAPEPLDCRRLVAESLQERVGKTLRVERLLRQSGKGFFDLNGVHGKSRFTKSEKNYP
jgi:hypothetical protein